MDTFDWGLNEVIVVSRSCCKDLFDRNHTEAHAVAMMFARDHGK